MRLTRILLSLLLAGAGMPSAAVGQARTDTARVTITGRVVDALSRTGLAGVRVRITELGVAVETDASGEFELRDIPRGTYRLTLDRPGYRPSSGDFEVMRSGSFMTALEPLNREDRPRAGRLTGVVIDGEAGEPLAGAEVRLPGVSLAGVTDAEGRFVVDDVPTGRQPVEFSFLGRATFRDTVTVAAGRTSHIRVPLPVDPVDLPSISVTVERREIALENAGFYERRDQGWGEFIDLEMIERRGPSEMTDLFSGVTGVTLMSDRFNPLERYVVLRGGLAGSFDGPCFPMVVLDGTVVHRDPDTAAMIDHLVDPAVVAGIEIYPRQAGIPLEYSGTGAACGLILIWTRR